MARRPLSRAPALAVALGLAFAGIGGGTGSAAASTEAAPVRPMSHSGRFAGFVPPPPAKVTSHSPGVKGRGFRATIYRWDVKTGPKRATTCSVLGELFVPAAASAARPDPVILTTNGFGGSYTDQVPLAELASRMGYVVLTYSGLGMGGSGCDIELDSPLWDGEAASQLISYLGDLAVVLKDGTDDPRLGMIGGSYGGEVQFATAAIDPRVDTIVPIITWDDLAYSLAPNNASPAFDRAKAAPGVLKWEWASLFFGDGLAEPFQNPTATPFPPSSCPGFDPRICTAFLGSVGYGYPGTSVVSMLRADSVVSYYKHIRIPVMLWQGEDDSLFNIAEAVANYRLFRSIGDPTKLVLQSWGHSDLSPAPGELSYTSLAHGYETVLAMDWFAKYLKHQAVSTGPAVEYFRPWVHYDRAKSAAPAYGTAASWPVGTTLKLYLSGSGALVSRVGAASAGSESFVNPPAGQPGSYSETSGVQDEAPFSDIPPSDPPGTFASFETAPLRRALDSVGIPILHFELSAPAASATDPALEPVVFAKLYDVSPSGKVTLVNRLVSPARLAAASGQFTVALPGVVHRYAKGDRIELVIAASDQAYQGDRVPGVITVEVSPHAGPQSVLDLPVVSPANERSGGPLATGA
ncbi:MAG: ABC transporter ATP-binding protein [Actinomycetota bacterium]|nr:ABC transporter ATP-binding protein [Actinomycetota bacterium]